MAKVERGKASETAKLTHNVLDIDPSAKFTATTDHNRHFHAHDLAAVVASRPEPKTSQTVSKDFRVKFDDKFRGVTDSHRHFQPHDLKKVAKDRPAPKSAQKESEDLVMVWGGATGKDGQYKTGNSCSRATFATWDA